MIIIDDKRGDGIVTYYFEDTIYKRYKNLEVISEDRWKISRLGKLQIFNNGGHMLPETCTADLASGIIEFIKKNYP